MHGVFWTAILVFYTYFFGYKSVDYKITFSFVVVLLPVTMATTYFLNYWLIPDFLFKKKYGRFFLYFIYTLIISFYVEMVTVMGIFILVAEFNMKGLQPSNTNALFIIAGMYLVVFLGVAVKLVKHYYQNEARIQILEKEKIEAELRFLKTQLHPHFLFNTLNNLYSLTLEKSDRASEVVLKLSELLDYVLYECNADFVPLEKEVKQLENYIELEKLRYGPRLDVSFSKPGDLTDYTIPPMVLMTLLENSFKHGTSKAIQKSWIKMALKTSDDWLLFEIGNSREKTREGKPEQSGGIGLENLRNRLNLLYGEDYHIHIQEKPNYYQTSLKMKVYHS